MTTLDASAATHGFSMLSIPEVDFNSYQSSSATTYSYLTDNGHDIDLFGAGFTGGAMPTGGTVTSGQIDFDNDDFLNPDVVFSGFSGDLATMTNSGATGNALDFINALVEGSHDSITGSGFADTLKGLGGDDTIFGGGGADSILGGSGDDFIQGGFGDDTMDGGSGNDFVDFTYSSESWLVDLSTNTTEASGIAIDSISNFENALMGSGNDSVTGTSGDNVLKGAGGDDFIK
ncbi:MAG TPA: hypothetical protein PKH09_14960, partial [Parvularculaceae bacterium]|nr:hypothetical protein [Parvularculaceae bacterium]